MLTILGDQHGRFCDGLSRRDFLKIGGLGFGGLSMPQILRAEAEAGVRNSRKSVIMIFLAGGPPHQDTFDLKMDAPSQIRGEFRPIDTNLPGLQICEHLPKMAQMMDKFVVIRSIVGATGEHYAVQCVTGRTDKNMPTGGWPSLGATVSKLEGSASPGVPPFVGLSPRTGWPPYGNPGEPGFLGRAYGPFRPNGDAMADMTLRDVSLGRLNDRKNLLARLDQFRRDADASGLMDGLDAYSQQAFGILTSSQLAKALDLEQEDPKTRERYGYGSPIPICDGAPMYNEHFLMARRLVEAGVRCVTVNFGRWDSHADVPFYGKSNFDQMRDFEPALDQCLTALIQDLHERGLDKDVSVVVWGEFGRTPKINNRGGRDHWPQVSCALLAGGGMRTGQVIGATDRLGGYAKERPVHFQEVFATLYHNLGIDVNEATVRDLSGRPQFLVEENRQPLPEVI